MATDDDVYLGIPGWNYTEWRKGQPEPTPQEVEAGILRIQAERKARRIAPD